MNGVPVPRLAVFDDAMQQFMADRSIEAGALTVMKNGIVLLEHGYGWRNREHTTLLPADALFRLAGSIRPVTAAAIKQLIAAGRLNASDRVFCLDGGPTNCILTITPFGTPDSSLKGLTIQHLLDNKGGWDHSSFDPMFQSIYIANQLGVTSPPSQQDTVRYVMGKPLNYTPGSTSGGYNFGYMVLGMVIAKVSGQDYTAYVQDHIFNPLGVAGTEIALGHTQLRLRNVREPRYADSGFGADVFDPTHTVAWPDGVFYLEALEGSGGMVASTRAMTEFMQANWLSGEPRRATAKSGCTSMRGVGALRLHTSARMASILSPTSTKTATLQGCRMTPSVPCWMKLPTA